MRAERSRQTAPGSVQLWRRARVAGLAGLLAFATPPLALAQDESAPEPRADLVEKARERFPVDDIAGPDGEGRYRLPKPGASDDARDARRLLEQAAAAGNAEAHRLLGEMVEAGAGGPQDFAAARRHYALAGGDRATLWRHGRLLLDGKGGAADLPLARTLFRQSSDAGQIDATYEVARMVELGLGGPRDEKAARALYEGMSEWCHGDMADRYSIMLMRGIGGPVDRARAAEFQLKAFECHNLNFEVPAAVSRPELFDSETILEIQTRLRDSGYDGPVDGRFNEATIAALRSLT